MKIVFATGNQGKLKEIREILKGLNMEILSLKDMDIKDLAAENGKTFRENAAIKARSAKDQIKGDFIVMADDSGLEVDYLNKEPGVYSARYLGENTPYKEKNETIIKRLEGVPDDKRTARFVCSIVAILPNGEELNTQGTIEGRIGYEERGSNGFGYDPIFLVPSLGKTTAELTGEEKNKISHRGKALELMKEKILERIK